MLSIVIPSWQAAETIGNTVRSVIASPLVGEVLVADGGSTDGTPTAATAAGARVVSARKGRGTQLAEGAREASRTWLLFLHADTVLEAGWDDELLQFMTRPNSREQVGIFRFSLDDRGWRAGILEIIVGWRCRAFALPYGDQGLLIHRSLYELLGGFRPLPLFEDVDLIRRAGRHRLAYFTARAITSAVRYRTDGYLARPVRNLACLSLYFAGVSPHFIGRLYQ